MNARKVIDEKNNIDIRNIRLTNKTLVARKDANISFEGIGKEQLLAIIDTMNGDFCWKLECRPTTGAVDLLHACACGDFIPADEFCCLNCQREPANH